MLTETPLEKSRNQLIAGGASGDVELAASDKGDIIIGFTVEYQRLASKIKPAGLSYRLTGKDLISRNLQTVEDASMYVANLRQNKTADSLQSITNAKRREEQSRLFEMKIKNSYAEVVQLQNSYAPSAACLKTASGKREEEYMVLEDKEVWVNDYEIAGTTSGFQWRKVEVTKKRLVPYSGQKNTCLKAVYIKGIEKLQSPAGTIYYEDRSIKLEPGEMTSTALVIEPFYYPSTAEIGRIYYYTNKLPTK